MILELVHFIYILEDVDVFLGCKNKLKKLKFTKFCGRRVNVGSLRYIGSLSEC